VTKKILVTGSLGLIGRTIEQSLNRNQFDFVGLDIKADTSSRIYGDVRERDSVEQAISGCDGVIHLAAVSRVVWGENDPEKCRAVNVTGTQNVINAAIASDKKPWLIFASSRETYGEPHSLPVSESDELRPMNVYGISKADGEKATLAARQKGLITSIVRFSNVYGRTFDHHDRVVPAFAAAAASGKPMRVDGTENTFDFTHVDDTVEGVLRLVQKLSKDQENIDPVHFLTGAPTTLGELADLANTLAGGRSQINIAPSRNYDVSRFYGNPTRALEILGWQASTSLGVGLGQLIDDFRDEMQLASQSSAVS